MCRGCSCAFEVSSSIYHLVDTEKGTQTCGYLYHRRRNHNFSGCDDAFFLRFSAFCDRKGCVLCHFRLVFRVLLEEGDKYLVGNLVSVLLERSGLLFDIESFKKDVKRFVFCGAAVCIHVWGVVVATHRLAEGD